MPSLMLTLGLPLLYLSTAFAHAHAPTARIENGLVIGTTTSLPSATATVNKFLGIPFAQSPPERFSPPQRASKITPFINATAWKPACIQQFVYPLATQEFTELVFNTDAPEESEDCLYLNVYAPSTPSHDSKGRAVMFWIYGGSLQFGNAGNPAYDGSHIAGYEDVIVVSVNYRTNVFGFPSSPELPVTGHNLGLLDQRFGLEWVQRNIKAFGGDPSKVTIFGESAGAFSIDMLLTSFPKNSTPPFRAAILESGQYSYRTSPYTNSVSAWYNLTAELNCPGDFNSNLTCVKAANAATIKNIIEVNELAFNPEIDNVTLVSNPVQRRLQGDIANVPVMGGTNAQEGRVFLVGQDNITAVLETYFSSSPALIQELEAAYPIGQNGLNTGYDVVSQIFTEYVFQCPQAMWANDTDSVGIPAWRYYYNASFPNIQPYPNLGVYHSSEIPLVFSTYSATNATTQEQELSNFMRRTWAAFAKDPESGPGWSSVATGDLGVLGNVGNVMGTGVTVIPQSTVDSRCAIYAPVYQAIMAASM